VLVEQFVSYFANHSGQVAVVTNRIPSGLESEMIAKLDQELAAIGFTRTSKAAHGYVFSENEATLRLHINLTREQEALVLQPLLVAEHKQLRQIIEGAVPAIAGSDRIAHIYLGARFGWSFLKVRCLADVEIACKLLVRAIREEGHPSLSPYLSLDGAQKLFEEDLKGIAPQGLVVFCAAEKLRLLTKAKAER
jgi:hypothetical protein